MGEALNTVAYISLVIHIVLFGVAILRVWRGTDQIDRLLATELVGTIVLAVLVLIAILERSSLFIDVAVGLGVLSFVGVIAYAKFVTDERMF